MGNKSIKKIKVYERIPKTNFDIIISTVKLYDFDHFVSELNNLDNLDNKIILPFQNGIYSEQKIIEELALITLMVLLRKSLHILEQIRK